MNHTLYLFSTFLHISAAIFWIGSMLFMSLVLIPALRAQNTPGLTGRMILLVGNRYKVLGWASLATLLVTGFLNLYARGIRTTTLADSDFWSSSFGTTLAWKLFFFAVVIVLSLLHDGVIGPRFRQLSESDSPKKAHVEGYRIAASWMGRLALLLSLIILVLAVMLVRGSPW